MKFRAIMIVCITIDRSKTHFMNVAVRVKEFWMTFEQCILYQDQTYPVTRLAWEKKKKLTTNDVLQVKIMSLSQC